MAAIEADLEALDAGGSVEATRAWTAAQNVLHVTIMIEGSLDGFDVTMPLPLRILGRMLKHVAIPMRMRPGIKLPKAAQSLAPGADITWEEAMQRFRTVMQRLGNGEQMTHHSPLFGPMTHAKWTTLHCRHAELHFSFLRPAAAEPKTPAAADADHAPLCSSESPRGS